MVITVLYNVCNVMQILCYALSSDQALGAISNRVFFRARAPRTVSRLGRLRQLSNGFGVFPLSRPAQHGPSAYAHARDCSRHGAREYAAIFPLSRVTAVPFLSPGSTILPLLPPETTRVSVFASFRVTAYRIPRTSRAQP